MELLKHVGISGAPRNASAYIRNLSAISFEHGEEMELSGIYRK